MFNIRPFLPDAFDRRRGGGERGGKTRTPFIVFLSRVQHSHSPPTDPKAKREKDDENRKKEKEREKKKKEKKTHILVPLEESIQVTDLIKLGLAVLSLHTSSVRVGSLEEVPNLCSELSVRSVVPGPVLEFLERFGSGRMTEFPVFSIGGVVWRGRGEGEAGRRVAGGEVEVEGRGGEGGSVEVAVEMGGGRSSGSDDSEEGMREESGSLGGGSGGGCGGSRVDGVEFSNAKHFEKRVVVVPFSNLSELEFDEIVLGERKRCGVQSKKEQRRRGKKMKLTSKAFRSFSVSCSPALGMSVFAKVDSRCLTSSNLTAVIAAFQVSALASHRTLRELWMSAFVRFFEKLRNGRERSSVLRRDEG